MTPRGFVLFAIFIAIICVNGDETENEKKSNLTSVYHQYCVVGAGPSGLQMGYFLAR